MKPHDLVAAASNGELVKDSGLNFANERMGGGWRGWVLEFFGPEMMVRSRLRWRSEKLIKILPRARNTLTLSRRVERSNRYCRQYTAVDVSALVAIIEKISDARDYKEKSPQLVMVRCRGERNYESVDRRCAGHSSEQRLCKGLEQDPFLDAGGRSCPIFG